MLVKRRYAVGAEKINESILSKIPPYSPNKSLLCFTPQSLLTHEIVKSPNCAVPDIKKPEIVPCKSVKPINFAANVKINVEVIK